ncbi:DUF2267 domain-containing protein [Actinomycetospora endophytica]|uniref:DUF2267 domain-containing protein n=1 Tax=Actinomycetospora endophytica TaxID=2291215 RepID=A0ABS8PHW9_9PSEU|nr:DUF2267 domain-containing protein [Actinomycetospora endophytica]MCD2197623.1 DUF2267 domain-containing protein [Actinomycetospora endophytica]
MQYGEIVNQVNNDLGLDDRARADAIVVNTLELLGQRVAGNEPAKLAAQLPQELKESLTRHAGAAETFDVDEFLRRLAQREGQGVDPEQARRHAQSVFATLGSFVSQGELDDVRSQLPAGYAPLFA